MHALLWLLLLASRGWMGGAAGQQSTFPSSPVAASLDSLERLIAGLESEIVGAAGRYDLRWSLAQAYANAAAAAADPARVKSLARAAQEQARVATTLGPEDVEGHYWLAVSSGILAEVEGGRTKVRMAEESWNESGWVLQRDSLHAGAHHLRGRIHAAVQRVNSVTRFLARLLLGGAVLGQATWSDAEYHLRRAVELAPDVPMHHFELAMTYRNLGRDEEMLLHLGHAAASPAANPVDERYRQRASAFLSERTDRN